MTIDGNTSLPWAAASPHRDATAAAEAVLAAGGNAVDGALAAATLLTVVYPNQCSAGGDLIAMIGNPDGSVETVLGIGRSAAAMSRDLLSSETDQMPVEGALTVTVPGVVAAWHDMAARWGTGTLGESLERAAAIAAGGVGVAPGLARDIERELSRITSDPGLAKIFSPGGVPLPEGDTLRQPELAQTLRAIARGGPDEFYSGRTAGCLLENLGRLGSPLTAHDWAEHTTVFEKAVSANYSGEEYMTSPAPTQGPFFLQGLAALERHRVAQGRELDALGQDARAVAQILKDSARDRDRMLGDPTNSPLDIASLLDGSLETDETGISAPRPRATGDTVAVVTRDSSGMWVCLIQSVFHAFGSGILDPATGVILHNRGASFSAVAGLPNSLEPSVRPPHSLMPVLVRKDGAIVGSHGTMGGRAQPQIHTHVALQLAAGADVDVALSRPRWVLGALEAGLFSDASARVERDAGPEVIADLEAIGFKTIVLPSQDDNVGHAQIIRQTGGKIMAASDPRADGAARTGAR